MEIHTDSDNETWVETDVGDEPLEYGGPTLEALVRADRLEAELAECKADLTALTKLEALHRKAEARKLAECQRERDKVKAEGDEARDAIATCRCEFARCREALAGAQQNLGRTRTELYAETVECRKLREQLTSLEAADRQWDKTSLVEIVEERDRLREQLATDRGVMLQKSNALAECQRELAAAQARAREAVDLLGHIPQVLPHQGPERGWVPRGSLLIGGVSEAIDMVREKLHTPHHTALDAALEQVREEGAAAEWERWVAAGEALCPDVRKLKRAYITQREDGAREFWHRLVEAIHSR